MIPLSQTSFGEPDGLFGINCGHRPRGVSDGLFRKSEVGNNDEEDKELYGKVCRQRELERKARKSKTEADMLEAAGDTEGAKEVQRRMAEQNRQLRAYCESNGLKYRSDRVRTYGAVEPKKSLDKSAGSGIIRADGEPSRFIFDKMTSEQRKEVIQKGVSVKKLCFRMTDLIIKQ